MGLIAVHRPSGVVTRECTGRGFLASEMCKPGLPGLPGQWVVLHTRIPAQGGGR
jgi:hypothetical protein